MIVDSDAETLSELSPASAGTQKIDIERSSLINEQVIRETIYDPGFRR
jgi:hypothetical protein